MKKILLLPFICLVGASGILAQNFDEGLQLYEEQNYSEAAEIFAALDDDRSILFTGKSYFGLQNFLKANEYLRLVAETSDEASFRQEALFTMALGYFRMKNHTLSLDIFYELIEIGERGRIRIDAQRIYRQIMRYLSTEQRFEVLKNSRYLPVAKDVVTSSYDIVTYDQYNALVSGFLNRVVDRRQHQEYKVELARPPRVESDHSSYPEPPEGMVYNIGVLLPAPENGTGDEFLIPRSLFYGITLAAEEFNSQHADKKILLTYKNSHRDPDSTAQAFQELILNSHVDAVIGPLFSEPAKRMAILAERFRIPMIAPLANSDEINIDYNYTYQMNPTFEVHGKMMARHAVQTLGLDTLAVITQQNALGTASAQSFRREAERLGAFISYYIEENFASFGYDLTEFTEVFTTDPEEIEEHNYIPTKGIYAPFTGQPANTLMNLLLTDLEVHSNYMVILGSEEWENTSLSGWQDRNFEIYYTKAFREEADTSTVAYMEQDFETRFGMEPDRFAKIGFDVGTFVFRSLSTAGNPVYLGEVMRNRESYDGLELSINLDQNRINQNLFIHPLTEPARERIP